MATLTELDALIDANPDAARGIAAAYEVLLGGVPTIDGFIFLINNELATNFGSNNPNIVFNPENIFINLANALVQGNPTAATNFATIAAGATSLEAKLGAIYARFVPVADQTADGLAFFSRPEAQAFYQAVAAERGVAGPDGAAIVGLASLLKILVTADVGIGDSVNDLMAAIDDGSALLAENGPDLTPIEIADGNNFDNDDTYGAIIDLTTGTDAFAGDAGIDIFEGRIRQGAQTLNGADDLDGAGGRDILTAELVALTVTPTRLHSIEEIYVKSPSGAGGSFALDARNADALDTIGFQSLGDDTLNFTTLSVTNVATALAGVSIRDSYWSNLEVTFTGDALDGANDALDITIRNAPGVFLTLDYDPGASNGSEGYEIANIASLGSGTNSLSLQGDSFRTINVSGDARLLLSAVEIGPLELFDASAFAGDLSLISFANNEDSGADGIADQITARGGSGADFLRFEGSLDSEVSAFGNGGADVFDFVSDASLNGEPSFTAEDSVDGGDGGDELRIVASGVPNGPAVELLTTGVGQNIVGVETIKHGADSVLQTDLVVDWTRKGSASRLEFSGDYGNHAVAVAGLTNTDIVEIDQRTISTLTLSSLNDGSPDNEISLTFDTGNQSIGASVLVVDAATELVRLSASGEGSGQISDAGSLNANVSITGATTIVIGRGQAYDKAGGIIDGSTATGQLGLYVTGDTTATGGSNADFIWSQDASRTKIFLDAGGADSVVLTDHNFVAGAGLESVDYRGVVGGFSVADDRILIEGGDLAVRGLDSEAGALVSDATLVIRELAAGESVNVDGVGTNFIKLTTAVDTATFATDGFDEAFAVAMGSGQVSGWLPGSDVLVSYYDQANSRMILAAVNTSLAGGDVLSSADAPQILTIASIGMSAADYLAFGDGNLDFAFF